MNPLEKYKTLILFITVLVIFASSITSIAKKRYHNVFFAIISGAILLYVVWYPNVLLGIAETLINEGLSIIDEAVGDAPPLIEGLKGGAEV